MQNPNDIQPNDCVAFADQAVVGSLIDQKSIPHAMQIAVSRAAQKGEQKQR